LKGGDHVTSIKYRQRLPGGKWKSYASPSDFLKNAECYTDIIKNYDEAPHIAVYHIGVCRNSADDRYFNHVTKRFKLVYVLEGSGWFNGIPVKSGQGFLMRKDHVNSMSADIRSPWKFIYVSFSGSLAEDLLSRAGFTEEDTIFDVPNIERVREICFDAVYEPKTDRVTDLYLLSILFELFSYSGRTREGARATSSKMSSDMNPHVLKAVAFMSKNYRSQISVNDIADAAHISEKYMRELFKKETGRSMQAYLTDLRLSAAKTLLSNSKYNISEVANLSGFPEYRNFVRVFKERYGITPTEYRTGKGE
jgi:AraC-like DNA-binding protein